MNEALLSQLWGIIKPHMSQTLMDFTDKYVDQCSELLITRGYSFAAVLQIREQMQKEVVKFVGLPKIRKDDVEIASSGVTIEPLKELQIPTPQELENLHRLESTDS